MDGAIPTEVDDDGTETIAPATVESWSTEEHIVTDPKELLAIVETGGAEELASAV
jgi:hypothetical protein